MWHHPGREKRAGSCRLSGPSHAGTILCFPLLPSLSPLPQIPNMWQVSATLCFCAPLHTTWVQPVWLWPNQPCARVSGWAGAVSVTAALPTWCSSKWHVGTQHGASIPIPTRLQAGRAQITCSCWPSSPCTPSPTSGTPPELQLSKHRVGAGHRQPHQVGAWPGAQHPLPQSLHWGLEVGSLGREGEGVGGSGCCCSWLT